MERDEPRPGDHALLVCDIAGRVNDDDFPGWIEVRFRDAAGDERSLVDKAPVLGLDDPLPDVAFVRCRVLEVTAAGAAVISTSPDGITTADGADEFTVPAALLRPT